jgi:integrase
MLWNMKTELPDTTPQPAQPCFAKVAECLYRNESSDIYYAFVKRHGKQFRRSLKTSDRQLAKRRLAEFREKVTRLSQTKHAGSLTFEELTDRWLETIEPSLKPSSYRRRLTCVEDLQPYFKDASVRNISARHCDAWLTERGAKLSARSFNIERETLNLIFDYARRDGLLLDNPASTIERRKQPKPKLVIPTRPQFRLLVEAIRSMDRRAWDGADLVELLAYSGMRIGEAVNLTWADVDFDRGVFTVTGGELGTKNLEARTVPLFPALRELLQRIRGGRSPAPTDRVIPISDAKKAIDTACQKAKLPHFTHHALRHYFVSNAIEAGVDFKVIANWVGHKDGGVLVAKTYGHLRDTHSFEMAKRMNFSATSAETAPANIVPLPTAASA